MLYILCRTVVLHCTSHSVAYSIFVPFFVVVIRVLFNTAHTTTFAFITNTNLWFQGFICYSEVPFSAGGRERERERLQYWNSGAASLRHVICHWNAIRRKHEDSVSSQLNLRITLKAATFNRVTSPVVVVTLLCADTLSESQRWSMCLITEQLAVMGNGESAAMAATQLL